jgi:hypothetical protein
VSAAAFDEQGDVVIPGASLATGEAPPLAEQACQEPSTGIG